MPEKLKQLASAIEQKWLTSRLMSKAQLPECFASTIKYALISAAKH